MYATCGHRIWRPIHNPVSVKIITNGNIHAISKRTLCVACQKKYEQLGLILLTKRDEEKWLRSRDEWA